MYNVSGRLRCTALEVWTGVSGMLLWMNVKSSCTSVHIHTVETKLLHSAALTSFWATGGATCLRSPINIHNQNTHTQRHTHSLSHTLTHTHTHTHTHSLTHTHTHTLSHTHTHARTHARTHALTHTHTHTLSLSHTHTHTHTHSLSHTHTHTHTHTHCIISQELHSNKQIKPHVTQLYLHIQLTQNRYWSLTIICFFCMERPFDRKWHT